MGLLALSYLVIGVQIYRSFHALRELGEQTGLPANHPYFEFIQYHEHSLGISVAIACAVTAIVSFVVLLVLSQRVAGPIVRMKGYFEAFAREGWKSKLQFRKGDFFSDLPEIVNRALERKP